MGSSILQAILGGVAGGASGIAEVREARRLEEERKAQAERQARADRLAYISAGFAPEAQAGRMDMPGATPRKPFMTETLPSGERMVMEQSPTERAHQATMREYTQKRGMERAEEERRRTTIDAAFNALPEEQQQQLRPFMEMTRMGIPANVQQQFAPKTLAPQYRFEEKTGQIVDLTTGKTVRASGYQPPPKEAKPTEGPKFSDVASLRKEFNVESRPYKIMNDALKQIEALGTKDKPTPQDLQALVYQFVKVQDPSSVVRESEYANAANAVALTDRIQNYNKMLLEGQLLTPTQRRDMVQTARALRQEAMNQYGALADSYEELAMGFNMAPKTVVPNRLDRQGPRTQSLEQEFPGREQQIQRARADGYSDADIRAFLSRGR